MTMTIRTKLTPCPSCGKGLDAATNATGKEAPKPDDLTICLYCGHLMAFTQGMTFRSLTEDEMREVAGDPRVLAIQKMRGKRWPPG